VLFLIGTSDWRTTNSPPTPVISPNTFNQNFEITIFFNIVGRSGNYVFEGEPHPLRTRFVSHALGAFKVFIERVIVQTSEEAHWIGNQKF
jgi:hypothetical protein